ADVRHAPPLRLDPPPVVARTDLEPNTRGEKRGTALVDEVRGKSVFLRRRERDRATRTVVAPERLDPDRGAVAPIERGSVVARLQFDGRAPQRELRSHLPGRRALLGSVVGVRAVELEPDAGAGQRHDLRVAPRRVPLHPDLHALVGMVVLVIPLVLVVALM